MGILSIFLQAVGILFLLWVAFGWLVFGGQRGGVCVRLCHKGQRDGAERFLRCCVWLREMGLLHMPVVLVDRGLSGSEREELLCLTQNRPEIILSSPEELLEILEKEVREIGGAGSAAGDGVGDRISEP